MSRILLGASAAAIMLAASALMPAAAQSGASGDAPKDNAGASIGALTCGDIEGLSETDASALIYYAAGYQDGLRDSSAMDADDAGDASGAAANEAAGGANADNSGAGGAGETPDAAGGAAGGAVTPPVGGDADHVDNSNNSNMGGASATPDIAASGGTMVGGLGLQAGMIIDACTRTPDALISELIASNGGSAGNAGGADSNAAGGAPADAATPEAPADNGAAATPK